MTLQGHARQELRVRCAQCDKLVDWWEVWSCPADREYTVKVRCHGAEEQCTVSENFVHQARGDLGEGVAFATKPGSPVLSPPTPASGHRGLGA